ncbi:hypothetical protein [Sporosarcina ureae]|uniref:hypothetical protein n=1 Tax=Sporosarcina ureae TaxID=1571 RepID=UPI001B7F8F12|nr:hypothetical protein [Sporosarcina ureae]
MRKLSTSVVAGPMNSPLTLAAKQQTSDHAQIEKVRANVTIQHPLIRTTNRTVFKQALNNFTLNKKLPLEIMI